MGNKIKLNIFLITRWRTRTPTCHSPLLTAEVEVVVWVWAAAWQEELPSTRGPGPSTPRPRPRPTTALSTATEAREPTDRLESWEAVEARALTDRLEPWAGGWEECININTRTMESTWTLNPCLDHLNCTLELGKLSFDLLTDQAGVLS